MNIGEGFLTILNLKRRYRLNKKITKQDIEWLKKEIEKVNNEIAILNTIKQNLENTLKTFEEKIVK